MQGECIAHKQSTVGYHPITSKPAHKQLQITLGWESKSKTDVGKVEIKYE